MTAYVRDDLRVHGSSPFGDAWAIRGDVVRAVKNRETVRFEAFGSEFYVKRHRRVGWGEILKNLVVGRLPVFGARNEYAACRHLTERGVNVQVQRVLAGR